MKKSDEITARAPAAPGATVPQLLDEAGAVLVKAKRKRGRFKSN